MHTDAKALCRLLSYEEETGILRWKQRRGRAQKGQRAGCQSPDGYRRLGVTIAGKRDVCLEHLIIFVMKEGRLPGEGMVVDHLNGMKNDNRWANLREISFSENVGRAAFPNIQAARDLPRNVSRDKYPGKYTVQIGGRKNKRAKSGLTLFEATCLAHQWRAEMYPNTLKSSAAPENMKYLPPIDGALVGVLSEQFPDISPDLDWDERTIMYRAGQVSVVRWLKAKLLEQETSLVTMELEGH